ncbi:MAG: SEC-C domain-containing protein [Lachnospiraceae bacterium]|nr:SEC-C domain-containing protein [Lachnospiraceae bacterium]
MGLLEQWQATAYDENLSQAQLQQLWATYFEKEKNVYAELLKNPEEKIEGTVAELAERFGLDTMTMVGFLDGINESLKEANPLEGDLAEDTVVNLNYDLESLYKNMVDAKAGWLYGLPEWEEIFDEEKRAELFKEAKQMNTVRKAPKVYPNDPCPCGSGKKYKKCCGRK